VTYNNTNYSLMDQPIFLKISHVLVEDPSKIFICIDYPTVFCWRQDNNVSKIHVVFLFTRVPIRTDRGKRTPPLNSAWKNTFRLVNSCFGYSHKVKFCWVVFQSLKETDRLTLNDHFWRRYLDSVRQLLINGDIRTLISFYKFENRHKNRKGE